MADKSKAIDLIKARVKKNKDYKNKVIKRVGPYGLVRDFIQEMEDVKASAKTALEFNLGLQRESGLLLDRFKVIDPDVDLTLRWNRPDKAEKWEDLLIEGVEIRWSKFYKSKQKFPEDMMYIDMADLFMKGLLDED